MRCGDKEAFIVLLLSRPPNLRRLELDSDFQDRGRFITLTFWEALGSTRPRSPVLPTFDRLQEVRWKRYDAFRWMDFAPLDVSMNQTSAVPPSFSRCYRNVVVDRVLDGLASEGAAHHINPHRPGVAP